ncbi:MAG TPA: hypothetical protein VHV75_14995 [Solirubrobacteraceae bacterium]|jgi:hypothetical protein|nr:hypothetical protein [Solirubrobacteraceae bacterium]
MRRALVLIVLGLLVGGAYDALRGDGSPSSMGTASATFRPADAPDTPHPRAATCAQLASRPGLSLTFLRQVALESNNELYTQRELEHIARGTALLLCSGSKNSAFRPWQQVLAATAQTDGYEPTDPAINGRLKPL